MRSLFAVIVALAPLALGNDLTVEPRTVSMNEMTTITVSLQGAFASLDGVDIPLENLRIVGQPWVSSEFSWINGTMERRKTLQYRAQPLAAGQARVGPVVLNVAGQRDTLAAVEVEVVADRVAASNDPESVLQNLLAAGRPPLFVVAEIEKTHVYLGEPVLITWFLYNAASIRQWQISSVPKLADFWTEELTRDENAERLILGDRVVQRLPIRRVALFPLRSGRMHIDGLTIAAQVMERVRDGPIEIFEGQLVDTTFTSAPLDVTVDALPPGPPVDIVGDVTLTCESPAQHHASRDAGPVVVRATLAGKGNLRAAKPPRFEGAVAGNVQIEGGATSVDGEASTFGSTFGMTRRWQYLIFPARSGTLHIPPLSMRTFLPRTGQRRDLRCAGSTLQAVAAVPTVESTPPHSSATPAWRWRPIPIAVGLAVIIAALFLIPLARRELRLRREVREIVRHATPAEIRARMEARIHIDLAERTDRGDAWRSLRSLLDAAEKERDIALNAEAEIPRRVREVLRNTER